MGVINMFLGGTGKYVAEEMKGLRAHYGLPLPDFIAFDLSREATHTGAFALGHDLLAPHEQFATTTMEVVAPAWADLDAGERLAPRPPKPGPQLRPEVTVMTQIAEQVRRIEPPSEGLWGLRAPGLLAFAAFMDPAAEGPEAEAANRFKNRVSVALRAAGRNGQKISFNIVASTAGGTGAGMFMPFAWWLLDHPDAVTLELNLVLIASSAFDNEPLDAGVNQREMRSKGRSGTFAIIRELELLERADLQASLANRRFPIATGNPTGQLRYRPGSGPFHRIYWMGRRAVDVESDKVDVYRETDSLVRILSNVEAVDDLDGLTGNFTQRLLPSVVTIDYPRLPLARQMSSHLAEAALIQLVEGEGTPKIGRRFFEFPGDGAGAFGKFLQFNENRAFATTTRGDANTTLREISELVEAYTDVRPHRLDYAGIPTGIARVRAGYASTEDEWRAYCAALFTDVQQRRRTHEERLDLGTRQRIRDETNTFRKFLIKLASDHLAPEPKNSRGPFPLNSLIGQVRDIRDDLEIVSTFFGHSRGIQGRLPERDMRHPKFASIERVDQLIAAQESEMMKPRERSTTGGLPFSKWLIELAVVIIIGVIGWFIGGVFVDAPILFGLVAVLAVVVGVITYLALRRRRTPVPELRRRAERRLFSLYDDLTYAYTGQAILSSINESFLPRASVALEALDSKLGDLTVVYQELLSNSRARAAEVYSHPAHSAAQVGSELSSPDIGEQGLLDPLIRSIRITPQPTQDNIIRDLLFAIGSEATYAAGNGLVGEMADTIREESRESGERLGAASRGGLDLTAIDAALDSTATTSLARHLPKTFEDALRHEHGDQNLVALDRHLAALIHKTPSGSPLQGQDRRRSSLDCRAIDATVKRMYVPSGEVQALVVQVMRGEGETLRNSVIHQLREYMGPGQRPIIVPELGASIAILSLWIPDVGSHRWSPTSIMDTYEGQRAHDTYYGVIEEAEIEGFMSQRDRNFHLIPELAAAAAIEMELAPVRPLDLSVVARLLGSHPNVGGPTPLELFYLLRTDGTIERAFSDVGVARREHWEIRGDHESVPLVDQSALIGATENQDPFGSGRRIINAFDAFLDFLLYDGAPLGGMLNERHRFAEPARGKLRSKDWDAIDNATLADIQLKIVQRWWTVVGRDNADAQLAQMYEILQADVEAMEDAEASDDWNRAVRYILGVGHRKRLALASST